MKIQKINTGIIITKTAKQPSAKIEFSLDELDVLSEFCEMQPSLSSWWTKPDGIRKRTRAISSLPSAMQFLPSRKAAMSKNGMV